MGNDSRVSDVRVAEVFPDPPVAFKKWQEFLRGYTMDYLDRFFYFDASDDESSAIYCVKLKSTNEAFTAYELDKYLPKLLEEFKELTHRELVGSFILEGEEAGDLCKYKLHAGGKITLHRAEVLFPEEGEEL